MRTAPASPRCWRCWPTPAPRARRLPSRTRPKACKPWPAFPAWKTCCNRALCPRLLRKPEQKKGPCGPFSLLGLLPVLAFPRVLLIEQLVGIEALVIVQALHLLDDLGRRVAVVDLVQALLAVGVTHEHVRIVGRGQEALRIDAARAQGHQIESRGDVLLAILVTVVARVIAERVEEVAV